MADALYRPVRHLHIKTITLLQLTFLYPRHRQATGSDTTCGPRQQNSQPSRGVFGPQTDAPRDRNIHLVEFKYCSDSIPH